MTTDTYGTLVLPEEQISKLLDAAAVDELIKEIEALPAAENVTLENETAIANALAHYNALSEEQQADRNKNRTKVSKTLHECRLCQRCTILAGAHRIRCQDCKYGQI